MLKMHFKCADINITQTIERRIQMYIFWGLVLLLYVTWLKSEKSFAYNISSSIKIILSASYVIYNVMNKTRTSNMSAILWRDD